MTPPALPTPGELFDLRGRVALITGGAGNLGGVFARALAGAGARVVLVDRDGALAQRRAAELVAAGAEGTLAFDADVGDEARVRDVVAAIARECGGLDILVNNAATRTPNMFSPLEAFPLEEWDLVMRVNLTAMFLCARAAAPLLREKGHGTIVNVASIYGISAPDQRLYEGVAFNTPAIYSASKAGVVGLTRYLATYYAPGIRCNALTPGGVFANQPAPFPERYAQRTPLGRMARAEEMGAGLLYLASDASSYVTGHNLVVDGGWTAW